MKLLMRPPGFPRKSATDVASSPATSGSFAAGRLSQALGNFVVTFKKNLASIACEHARAKPSSSSTTTLTAARFKTNMAPSTFPRPALRWVGEGGRIALREFDFVADADAVCSWQRETYSLNFPDFRYTENFAAAFRHDLRRGALDPNHGIFVLDEGQLVGFMWLVICENTWTGDRYGYINNLYLVGEKRGQGLARELMGQAERWFRGRGIKRARLTVTASNETACALYEKCGYNTMRWEMEKEL